MEERVDWTEERDGGNEGEGISERNTRGEERKMREMGRSEKEREDRGGRG